MSCGGHRCASVWVRMHCGGGCVHQYGVCSIPPLAISRPTESSQIDGGNEDTRTAESSQNEDILSQKVYGKFSVLCHFCLL